MGFLLGAEEEREPKASSEENLGVCLNTIVFEHNWYLLVIHCDLNPDRSSYLMIHICNFIGVNDPNKITNIS